MRNRIAIFINVGGLALVMGVNRAAIVTLFLWQFSKPIAGASLLARLQRYSWLDMWLIVVAGLAASVVALLLAWLIVGVMARKQQV